MKKLFIIIFTSIAVFLALCPFSCSMAADKRSADKTTPRIRYEKDVPIISLMTGENTTTFHFMEKSIVLAISIWGKNESIVFTKVENCCDDNLINAYCQTSINLTQNNILVVKGQNGWVIEIKSKSLTTPNILIPKTEVNFPVIKQLLEKIDGWRTIILQKKKLSPEDKKFLKTITIPFLLTPPK